MFKQKRLTVLSIAVLLALLIAAVMPFVALADDSAPPPPDVPVVDVPPTDVQVVEVAPTDAPVVDEPVAEDSSVEASVVGAPVAEAAVMDEPIVEGLSADVPVADEPVVDTHAEDLTVPEVLDQVPAGTDVVVLNESGQSVPLTSMAAADAILTSDPMWCPAGKRPGDAGCTAGYTTVADLINDLKGVIGLGIQTVGGVVESGDGTIFFTSSYDTNDVTFNSANLSNLGALTLQGGWNGKTLGNYALSGVTTFSVPVTINWDDKKVTINDIKIIGNLNPMTTTTQAIETSTGLTVTTTTGDIVLNHVESNNNTLYGIDIRSDSVGSTGIIPDPSTGGNVSLNDVTANANGANGTMVNTTGTLKVVSGQFNGNQNDGEHGGDGLFAFATGGITLKNVIANDNEGNGLFFMDANTNVFCSHFENNTWANIGAESYPEVNLTLNGVTFAGTPVKGDIDISGNITVVRNDAYSCSSCGESGSGGGEDLKNKDTGTSLPQVIAVPAPLADSELPGALPKGKTLAAVTSIKLLLGGVEINEAPSGVQVFLDIPAGMQPPISVLSWNGTEWVLVPSEIMDGKIVFTITTPGVFALVTP